MLAYRLILTSR